MTFAPTMRSAGRLHTRIPTLLFAAAWSTLVLGQQLVDNFNRAANTTVGGGWSEVETIPGGAQVNAIGQLELGLGTIANGKEYVVRDAIGLYNTTLSTNTCDLTWGFCVRQSRPDPSGFATGNYGVAFVLGGTTSDMTLGQGYAVIVGNTSTPDPIRLVRYINGLDAAANITSLIAATPPPFNDPTTGYTGVRVVYTPSTNTWRLFAKSLSAITFGTTNPSIGGTLCGTVVDATYTGSNLRYVSCFWNHASTATESSLFDNVHVPGPVCLPTVDFATSLATIAENGGSQNVNLTFNPATTVAGTVTLTLTNGAGANYGTDYTTTPGAVGNTVTLNIPAGATTATFPVTLVNDIFAETTETVTFVISGTTGGITIGLQNSFVLTITDDDTTPTVQFTTLGIIALESGGVQLFGLTIFPTSPAAQTATITISNGPGANYTSDYVTNPGGGGGTITVNIPANASSVTFQASIVSDATIESDELITFSLTSLSGGLTIGPQNAGTLTIVDDDTPPAPLDPGDLLIVGINANATLCTGNATEDEVSFFCFKPITPGTTIDMTDNGYSFAANGLWGDTEGVIRAVRTGPTIPAGQVITFRFLGSATTTSVSPDGLWSFTSLNGTNALNLNSTGGDQIFFMQGGVWNNPGAANDATYSGDVLFGFSTNGQWLPLQSSTSHSGLPIQLECFSMAPTTATNFCKYTGALTSVSKRQWIIRVDDPVNWTSMAACATYSATPSDWLLAPILPFSSSAFVAGLWTGAKSVDWFDCRNWDDAKVPIASTDVVVDQTRLNLCYVDGGGTAVCNDLLVSTNSLTTSLNVQNASTLNCSGDATVQRTFGVGTMGIYLLSGSTFTTTNLTMIGPGPGTPEAIFQNTNPANVCTLSGDLTLQPGGFLDMSFVGPGGTLQLAGDWYNLANDLSFDEFMSTVEFNGVGNQTINTTGFLDFFGILRVDKPSGDLVQNDPVGIRNNIDLLQGRVMSAPGLRLNPTATATGYTDGSFVHGPMTKLGTTNFTYPVGKGNSLRPAALTGVTGSGSDAFTVEYFAADPTMVFGTPVEPTLDHVSECEYWTIDRDTGTPNATVLLSWDTPESCGVTALPALRVARWSGVIWEDKGQLNVTGNTTAGTLETALQQSVFSPWTLASTNTQNPLPIELLAFTAAAETDQVRLDWSTASERDNAYFTVERGRDPQTFEAVTEVPGAGTSLSTLTYQAFDHAPLPGTSYYRLRQTDLDGTSTVSNAVPVTFTGHAENGLVVIGSGEQVWVEHDFAAGAVMSILDASGRTVLQISITDGPRTPLPIAELPAGAYMLRLNDGGRMATTRFVR